MPSYITSPIHDGSDTNWKNMVLRTIPQFYYHGEVPENEEALERASSLEFTKKRLEELKAELEALEKKSDKQLLLEQEKFRRERLIALEAVKKEKNVILDRYNVVKGHLEAWDAGDLEFVKKHALQLIEDSIKFDWSIHEEWYILPTKSAKEIRESSQESLVRLIGIYQNDLEKAEENYKEAKKTLEAIRKFKSE